MTPFVPVVNARLSRRRRPRLSELLRARPGNNFFFFSTFECAQLQSEPNILLSSSVGASNQWDLWRRWEGWHLFLPLPLSLGSSSHSSPGVINGVPPLPTSVSLATTKCHRKSRPRCVLLKRPFPSGFILPLRGISNMNSEQRLFTFIQHLLHIPQF